MVSVRAAALVLFAFVAVGCGAGAEAIPECEGTLQVSITNAAGDGLPTREDAAIAALESAFEIDVDRVALVPVDGRHFRVVVVDLRVLERGPRVSVQRNGDGFSSDGLVC